MNSLRTTIAGFVATMFVVSICTFAQDDQSVWDDRNLEIRSLPRYGEAQANSTNDSPVNEAKSSVRLVDNSFDQLFDQAYQAINSNEPEAPTPSASVQTVDGGKNRSGQTPKSGARILVAALPKTAIQNPAKVSPNSSEFSPQLVGDSGNLNLGEMTPLPPSSKVNPGASSLPISRFADDQDTNGGLWWKQLVVQPLSKSNVTESTDPNTLIYLSLKNSPRIQAISKDPIIRELQVTEAKSDFDPVSFVRGQWDDRNDPVGNTLTTGGAPFLEDHIITAVAGVRRKLPAGGDIEIGQTIGFQNSNSRFFVPQDQGTATLALNYTQPLMRGRGKYFNKSQILIAQSSGGVAWEAFKAELQEELEQVVRSYWQLYYERSLFIQKKRNVSRGETILELLEGRRELDSLPNQIVRAKSAVLSRKTELANAFNDVRNAETEVRRLIADPNWLQNQAIELLPAEPAVQSEYDLPLKQVVETAMSHRPEIKESLQRAKIAAIQYDVGTNELLPELSLLFGTYLSALDGDSGIERAFQSQFSGTTPGYSVGFEFEFPLHNRAARSRLAQRSVQQAKIKHEVNEVMQNIIAEAQVAQRRVSTAMKTMDAAQVAIEAAQADLTQNRQRWESFALVEGDIADGQTPTTVLDQLLDSQDRLTNAEFIYSQAELELKLSEVGLRRVMGTLLLYDNVVYERTIEGGAPSLSIGQGEDLVDPALQSTPTGPGQKPFNDTEMMSPEQLEQLQSDPPVTPSTPNASQSKFEPHLPIQRAGSVSGETEFPKRTFGYPLQDSSKQ